MRSTSEVNSPAYSVKSTHPACKYTSGAAAAAPLFYLHAGWVGGFSWASFHVYHVYHLIHIKFEILATFAQFCIVHPNFENQYGCSVHSLTFKLGFDTHKKSRNDAHANVVYTVYGLCTMSLYNCRLH